MSRQMFQIVCFIFCLICCLSTYAQEQGQTITSVYFGGGSYMIDDEQRLSVKEFIEKIPNVEHYSITVHSHTDNIGGAEYNEWLSQQRSNSAVYLLEALGIERELVEIQDFGQFNPIFTNDTWLGRMKNRRVDIIFWPINL